MGDRWYYGQANNKLGPFTPGQLRELAASGGLLGTDMVWKEGVVLGALAARVKNLFRPLRDTVVVVAPPPLSPTEPAAVVLAGAATAPPPEPPAPIASPVLASPSNAPTCAGAKPLGGKPPAKKGRAVAGRGVRIVGQDGVVVQFKKICIKCGYEDPVRSTLPIRNGTTPVSFFCPKCKKSHQGEIQGKGS
jgi:hypothetical protein